MQKKSFSSPDETRTPPKSKIDVVTIDDEVLLRMTFDPGWKWSEHINPNAGPEMCHVHHLICGISGQLKVVANDGSEEMITSGDVVDIPPGHDAWVIGDEQFVGLDLIGGKM